MTFWPGVAAALLLVGLPVSAAAQTPSSAAPPPPVIDMHLHARGARPLAPGAPSACAPYAVWPRWDPGVPDFGGLVFNRECADPIPPAASAREIMDRTLAIMAKRNIIGMVTGRPEDVRAWKAAAPGRVISGLDLRLNTPARRPDLKTFTLAELEALHASGELDVLGEIMAQYEGAAPDDPRLEPYFAFAERHDIPVGYHMAGGGPGDPYTGSGAFRARLGDPLLLEDVLVRHPKLRIYIMHAGYPFAENLRALMFSHPQVYVDISAIVHSEPRPAFHAFLRQVVEAGFGDRILFGTDQGLWPELIERSIQVVEDAPFLTPEQKRDILYNNAARFLRLGPEVVARHHGG